MDNKDAGRDRWSAKAERKGAQTHGWTNRSWHVWTEGQTTVARGWVDEMHRQTALGWADRIHQETEGANV